MLTAKMGMTEEENYLEYEEPQKLKHFTKCPSVATYYRDCDAVNEYATETYNEDYDSGIIRNNSVTANPINYEIGDISKVEEEDETLRPSNETMRVASRGSAVSADSASRIESKQHVKITTRGKAMIAVYAAVIVAIIIVIALNAVAITSLSASVAGLESQLETVSSDYKAANNELSEVSYPNVDSIPDGFVKVGSSEGTLTKVDLPKVAVPSETLKSTNWFDSVCEFFSGIFGG